MILLKSEVESVPVRILNDSANGMYTLPTVTSAIKSRNNSAVRKIKARERLCRIVMGKRKISPKPKSNKEGASFKKNYQGVDFYGSYFCQPIGFSSSVSCRNVTGAPGAIPGEIF